MTEYTAFFKKTVQISPDDWEVHYPMLQISDETTIGEIKEWANGRSETLCGLYPKGDCPATCTLFFCRKHSFFKMPQFTIVEHDVVGSKKDEMVNEEDK